jgi:hypothetical protein
VYTVVGPAFSGQRRKLFRSNGRCRLDGRLVDMPVRLVDAGLVNVRIGISGDTASAARANVAIKVLTRA